MISRYSRSFHRGSKFEIRDVLRLLEEAGIENKLSIYDDGRMIVVVRRVTWL